MSLLGKIEIVIDENGRLQYQSSLSPAATVFYLEFVKMDVLIANRLQSKEKKAIIVPEIVPPTRPEG